MGKTRVERKNGAVTIYGKDNKIETNSGGIGVNAPDVDPDALPVVEDVVVEGIEGDEVETEYHNRTMLIGIGEEDERPYASWTPVEVDTEMAKEYEKELRIRSDLEFARVRVYQDAGVKRHWTGRSGTSYRWDKPFEEAFEKVQKIAKDEDLPGYVRQGAQKTLEGFEDAQKELRENREKSKRYNQEFFNRGGWTRAFLAVTNGNGHVHSSMNCSTCNNGEEPTRFSWMTNYSGESEAKVVEDAGERACTACYPTAPVDTWNRPTKMFSDEEIVAAKNREEKAKAKVERDAKRKEKAPTASGEELVVSVVGQGYKEHFKTEISARNWYVREKTHAQTVGHWAPDFSEKQRLKAYGEKLESDRAEAFQQIEQNLAEKHGVSVEEIRADLAKKVAAKVKKETR